MCGGAWNVRRCVPSSDLVQRFTDFIENIGYIDGFTFGLDATALPKTIMQLM